MKKLALLCMGFLVTASLVWAEEHQHGTIEGEKIHLKTFDHAFAGELNRAVAFGEMNHEAFTSELKIRKYGQTIKAVFEKQGQEIGGKIEFDRDGARQSMAVKFVGLDQENQTITLEIAGEQAVVQITADEFVDNHFIHPTYATTYKGEEIKFSFSGKACYGYSLHLLMMILGGYLI